MNLSSSQKPKGFGFYFLLLLAFIGLSLWQHRAVMSLDIQGVHTWRQSQTMWNVRNFARQDANILNTRVSSFNGDKDNLYRYEFPVLQWGLGMAWRGLGESILLLRLLLFGLGALTVFGFFLLLHQLCRDWLLAFVGAVLFQYSPVFYYYTVNPLPDNLALAAGIYYLYALSRYLERGYWRDLLLASFCLSLATAAKLPFLMYALASILPFFQRLYQDRGLKAANLRLAWVQLLWLLPTLAWYAWVMPGWKGNPVLKGVFGEATPWREYARIIVYHAREMFPNILLSWPVWALFVWGAYRHWQQRREPRLAWIAPTIFITFLYLLLQLNAINTVHDYYMFPFLPWLYAWVALGLQGLGSYLGAKRGYAFALVLGLSAFYTPRYCAPMWSIEASYFNADLFVHSEALQKAVPRDERCIILNDHTDYIFSYRIDKMGYIFHNDYLPIEWVDDIVRNDGVRYLYTDSQPFIQRPELQPYLDTLLLQAGSIQVYRLKLPQ